MCLFWEEKEKWINARQHFSIILKKMFHYWCFQVAPGLFI